MTYRKDLASPTFQLPSGRGRIPTGDLPNGTPLWIGTSGDRASRPTDRPTNKPSPNYLKLYLPTWADQLAPPPLSTADAALVDKLK